MHGKPGATRSLRATAPSGLALDAKKNVLFSVCDNKVMIVSDRRGGKVLATPRDRQWTRRCGGSMTRYAFSANREGTLRWWARAHRGSTTWRGHNPEQLGARSNRAASEGT